MTDADCDDADACTADTCEAGGCVSRLRPCFDGASCLLATPFDMPDCTRKVMRKLGKFTKRAGKKLAKAERKLLAGKLGPVDRLLEKSARQLEVALAFIGKQVTRGKIPEETCAAAAETAIMSRLTQVNEVRFGDCQP